MEINHAVQALGALAQPSRLQAFRLLVRCGRQGMASGEIARALKVPHNTLSAHLNVLLNAGLVVSRREGRSIFYRVDLKGMRTLLAFLLEDCCHGRPELCEPLLASLSAEQSVCADSRTKLDE